jgi:hypothetical protein
MNIRPLFLVTVLTILCYGLSSTSSKIESGPKLTKEEVLNAMYEQLSDYCFSSLYDGSAYSVFKEYHYYNLFFRSEFPDLVIYNGRSCPGYESNSVDFFEFQQGKLVKFFWFSGQLLRWNGKQFRIHHSPCCAEIIDAIVDFDFNWNSETRVLQRESHIFILDDLPLETMEEIIETKHKNSVVSDSLVCFYGLYGGVDQLTHSSLMERKLIVLGEGSPYEIIEFNHRKGFQLIRFIAHVEDMNQIRVFIYEHLLKSQTVWIYAWIED